MNNTFTNIPENGKQFPKRPLLLAIVGVCFASMLFIAYAAYTSHIAPTSTTKNTRMSNSSSPTINTSPMSQNDVVNTTYTDPQNYFHISIPENWYTEHENGTNTYTDPTNQQIITQQIEITKLFASSTEGITIQIFTGVPACPLNQPLTSTFAGLPASYNEFTETWTIPTTKALVSVSIFYPGSELNYQEFKQDRSSLPSSSEIENQRNDIKKVINTMKLSHLTSYNCK